VKTVVRATADSINDTHRLAQQSAETAIDYAIACGELLIEMKTTMSHGEWTPWVDANCNFKWSTAKRYMKAATQKATGIAFSTLSELYDDRDNHRAIGTGENEWHTPAKYIVGVKEVLGSIELDPASSKAAQKIIKAKRYFTKDDDGLTQSWMAETVFLNPPYAQPVIAEFIKKLVLELSADNIDEAILLTHNYTDTAWFHMAEFLVDAICFTKGRIGFISPDGEVAAPTQGQAFFYFGGNEQLFTRVFSEFGFVR